MCCDLQQELKYIPHTSLTSEISACPLSLCLVLTHKPSSRVFKILDKLLQRCLVSWGDEQQTLNDPWHHKEIFINAPDDMCFALGTQTNGNNLVHNQQVPSASHGAERQPTRLNAADQLQNKPRGEIVLSRFHSRCQARRSVERVGGRRRPRVEVQPRGSAVAPSRSADSPLYLKRGEKKKLRSLRPHPPCNHRHSVLILLLVSLVMVSVVFVHEVCSTAAADTHVNKERFQVNPQFLFIFLLNQHFGA